MDFFNKKNRLDSNASLSDKLINLHRQEQELQIEKEMLIEKSLRNPTSPRDVVYATNLLKEKQNKGMKSYLLDPLNNSDLGGFRSRQFLDISFGTLRAMAKNTGLISAIIGTRKEQVASYAGYSTDELKPGWCITKNVVDYFGDTEEYEKQKTLSNEDKEEIKKIINFIENCGIKERMYHGDTFDIFLRKFVEDSLTLDQACFEITESQFGTPYEFFMVDGATIRFCSPEIEDMTEEERGYYPYACQIYQNNIYTSYYPWELCMAIRNPTNNFLYNGYGISELELLVKMVTYMLYAESYTGKFFSQGSNPKGIFLAKGNLSEDKLAEFRQAWTAQISGVNNSHKIPILSGSDIEWVDWQHSNQDMEFSNWLDYLAKVIFAIFKIDGKEVGYNVGAEGSVTYESSVQEKLTYSKEKGLIPLLKFIEMQINKYIVYPLSKKKYKFQFTGVDNTQDLIEKNDLEKVEKGVMSFQEYRAKHGLPTELEENDFLLNSTWIQYKQMQMGGQQGMNPMGGMMGMGNNYDNENHNHEESHSVFSDFVDDNPFVKDLENYAIEKGYK